MLLSCKLFVPDGAIVVDVDDSENVFRLSAYNIGSGVQDGGDGCLEVRHVLDFDSRLM